VSDSSAAETVLIRTSRLPVAVASAVRDLLRATPGLKVTDISSASRIIGSSLTAVDLFGLTRLELAFSFLAIVATSGLILALGLADRRRSFAILALLGANRSQLGGFLWSEGLIVLLTGAVTGLLAGFAVAATLVSLLTGVFDPPPDRLQIPAVYLSALAIAALAATSLAVLLTLRSGHSNALQDIRRE
jgi:putative ABC transport system permease protein